MPIARVLMPDGRIGRFEVPEGMAAPDIEALAMQHPASAPANISVAPENQRSLDHKPQNSIVEEPAPQPTQFAQPQPKGFFAEQRQRGAESANLDAARPEGVASQSLSNIHALGQAGAGVMDMAGNAAKFGYDKLMTDAGKQRLSDEAQKIMASPAGQMGIEALKKGGEIWNTYKQANPQTADLISSGLNITGGAGILRGVVKGAGLAADAAGSARAATAPLTAPITNKVSGVLADRQATKPLTSADRKVYSGALYDIADETGGALKPEARAQFRNEITRHADVDGEKLTSEKSIFDDMLTATEANADKPLTLKTFKTYDQKLTSLIHKERSIAGMSPEGLKLMELQDSLRDMVDNPSPDMVVGGKEGFDALRKATHEYKLSKQQEEFEKIIEYANKTDNPATSLKAQLRVLSKNKKRMAGYDAETRKLINKGAEDDKFADFLRTTLGSRLISGAIGGLVGGGGGAAVGGGIGAIPGAIGGALTGMASRSGAKAMKTRQIKKIEKNITSKSGAESIPREIFKLPPAEAKQKIKEFEQQRGKK